MENLDTPLGIISRNEQVRKWAIATPKCPLCGFFVTCAFSGTRNEFIWPHCSNIGCSLYSPLHTFVRPEVEKE